MSRIALHALLGVALVAGAGCAARPVAAPEFFASPNPALRALPFSEAVRVGDLVFVAGQVGIPPGGSDVVPGGLAAETRQVMDNIRDILERHGSSLDRAVKCTVFLTDMREWPAFNDVYRGYFKDHFPARSALGASGLAKGARVEVECIAAAR